MASGGKPKVSTARETLDILVEMSRLLNTGLDEDTLALCVRLCENGVNPDALALVIQALRRESTAVRIQPTIHKEPSVLGRALGELESSSSSGKAADVVGTPS